MLWLQIVVSVMFLATVGAAVQCREVWHRVEVTVLSADQLRTIETGVRCCRLRSL
jgi:hypothetical protein